MGTLLGTVRLVSALMSTRLTPVLPSTAQDDNAGKPRPVHEIARVLHGE